MRRLTLTADQLCRNPDINPRSSPGNVADLAAQIEHRGFADPLWVRPAIGHTLAEFEVIDGSRRLAALQLLWEQGKIADDFPIPCDVFDVSVEEAREMALAANVVRSDLSPADEAQGFYRLKLAGMATAEIAAHFAVPERRVEQRLRLGSLPPEIMAALRAGEISLETAQAFTLTPSAERQSEIFAALKADRGRAVTAGYVKQALTHKSVSASDPAATFVGEEDYAAAGGVITRDLFGDRVWFDDAALLARLFNDKLAATAQALKDEGWSSVEIERDPNKTYRFASWNRIEPKGKRELSEAAILTIRQLADRRQVLLDEAAALDVDEDDIVIDYDRQGEIEEQVDAIDTQIAALEAKPFTAGQMKKAAAVIKCGHSRVEIVRGLTKPVKGKEAEKAGRDVDAATGTADDEFGSVPAEPVKAGYSDAVEDIMCAKAAEATRLAMATVKPAMAYRMGLAARILQACDRGFDAPFAGRHDDQTVEALNDSWSIIEEFQHLESFADVLALLETKTPEHIVQIEAVLTADLLKFNSLGNQDVRFVIDAIDPDMRAAGFTVDEAFLKMLSREQLADIVEECGKDRPHKSHKKPELVAGVLQVTAEMGWLPAKLRTPSYIGPGSNAWADARSAATLEAAE